MSETLVNSTAAAAGDGDAGAAARSAAKKRSGGLSTMLLADLRTMAGGMGVPGAGAMKKAQLVEAIKGAQTSGTQKSTQAAPEPASATTAEPAEKPRRRAAARSGAAPTETAPAGPAAAEPTRSEPAAQAASAPAETAPQAQAPAQAAGETETATETGAEPTQEPTGRARRGRTSGARPESTQQEDPATAPDHADKPQSDRRQVEASQPDHGRPDESSAEDGQQDRYQGDGEVEGRRNRRRRGRDRDRLRPGAAGTEAQPGNGTPAGTTGRGAGNAAGNGSSNVNGNGTGAGGGSGSGSGATHRRSEVDTTVLEDDVLVPAAGILDVLDNYAFVRTSGYLPGSDDVYVSLSLVRRLGLRRGDAIVGQVRQPREGERKEKFDPMVRIDTVNGVDPETARSRVDFADLTPVHPSERLRLETTPTNLIGRVIDIAAPLGKGQRGLVVSPAEAGKTTVLASIATSITANNPECHLMVVLVDERPEEVTDFERSVKGEVIASTFDRPSSDHTLVAELALERAKRLVELGHDVVLLLDGITRLGRAHNLSAAASGRVLAGGVDPTALHHPKRFFGAARNVEDGGSLTILATATVESGSSADEAIFEELQGTGNMVVRLRRDLAEKRLFPAIDAVASGTRHEDLLMSAEEVAIVWKLRRVLSGLDGQPALELLLGRLRKSQNNIEFLMQVQKTTPVVGD